MKYKRILSFSLALAFIVLSIISQDRGFESDANQVNQLNYVSQEVA